MNLTNKVKIIAEIGVNHNGSLYLAKKLIKKAKECGADYIKFQTFDVNLIATESANLAPYQKKFLPDVSKQKKMLSKLSLTNIQFIELAKYCKKIKIKFLSSAFDIPSMLFLQKKISLDYIKIPSGEINNTPYLEIIARFNKKVLLSTGMSTLHEIKSAKKILEINGTKSKNIIIMHCTSDYPTKNKDLNMRFMNSLKKISKIIGFSDHSRGYEASIAAVVLGARYIEKHFTLNKSLKGPDHAMSLDVNQFKIFVEKIRTTEELLGRDAKIITKGERVLRKYARKSIVASKDIKKGDIFAKTNLTTKRPGDGLSPVFWNQTLRLRAKKNYKKDEKI
jgi:N,N'-diacetyllegionaminate synthase